MTWTHGRNQTHVLGSSEGLGGTAQLFTGKEKGRSEWKVQPIEFIVGIIYNSREGKSNKAMQYV